MIMTTACRRGLVAAGCVILVGFFMLVRWALEQPLDEKAKSHVRPSEYEIASGMSVRYRHLHAESVSIKAARIRRRSIGAFALGAFKVLELEEVSLNLPLPAEMGADMPPKEKRTDGATAQFAPAQRKDRSRSPMDKALEKIGLSGIGRFSGVAIRGLRVGRMTETGAEPLLIALKAETKGASLHLSRCEVFRDGKRESVPEARLHWKDGLRLVWQGGSLDLPELVENGKTGDGK